MPDNILFFATISCSINERPRFFIVSFNILSHRKEKRNEKLTFGPFNDIVMSHFLE